MLKFLPADRLDSIPSVAVAFRRVGQGTHAGVIYKDRGGSYLLLHLRGPLDLQSEPVADAYGWLIPTIPPERARVASRLCHYIAKKQPRISYGFKHLPETLFNTTDGSLMVGDGCRGLTCATFVLAVFHSCRLPLVRYDDWDIRVQDGVDQLRILDAFRDMGVPVSELNSISAELPCVRFRAEEVAGACAVTPLPAGFVDAVAESIKLMAAWDEHAASLN